MSSNKPNSGLGRGLQALLGEQAAPSPSSRESASVRTGGVREIDIDRIQPNPKQPRVQFKEDAIDELAESIAQRGVLQPILVRPQGDGFEIIAGERRWRAAQRARLHAIPALVREIDDSTAAEIALIENVQREDLNAIEEAEGYKQLIERHGHTQENVAKLVHKSRSHVANFLRLIELPDFVRQSLVRGDISMGHARAVAAAHDPEGLVKEIIAKGLSVRQTEDRARSFKASSAPQGARTSTTKAVKTIDADLLALERQLGDMLGLKVQITHNGRRGTVTLHYGSLDQLDMVCQRLSGEPI
jgi:ParB family transcriptional regulator, chromosome partitioning protein